MKQTHRVTFLPSGVSVKVDSGVTLFNAALVAGYTIHTGCGLQGTCGRCRVTVEKGSFHAEPSAMLKKEEIQQGHCLACMTKVEDDLTVELREELCHRETETQVRAVSEKLPRKEALAYRTPIAIKPAEPGENLTDRVVIQRELLRQGYMEVSWDNLKVLRSLSRICHGENREIAITMSEEKSTYRILDIQSGSLEEEKLYGVAVDLGTTTVAARLLDLEKGEVLCETGKFNSQLMYGDDIIHRIVFADQEGGLEKLRALAHATVNDLIESLARFQKISTDRIMAMVIAGNTTMEHLFMGMDPKYIRLSPNTPGLLRFPLFHAYRLGLSLHPAAPIYITPGMGSYVGGDISAGLASARVDQSEFLTLYLDLGTNGEIVLGNREWMVGCACSCGPAFEGSGIRCGTRYADGAVESILMKEKDASLSYRVVGNTPPEGLCGSALIDLMAGLYRSGRIDKKGRFHREKDDSRFTVEDSTHAFRIIPAEETGHGRDIVITEKDLENLIRTKGAVWAAISTLLKKLEIKKDDIQKVVIAGNFGRTLHIINAITIGMLPHLPRERFTYIGNASLTGASRALLSRDFRDRMEKISTSLTYIDLSTLPGYMDEFVASLFIPHTDEGLFLA